jgi:hypothetical protein
VKKRKPEVVLVSTGDNWEALYIDGKVVEQRHSFTISAFLDTLAENGISLDVKSFDEETASAESVEEAEARGCFPDRLADIKMV